MTNAKTAFREFLISYNAESLTAYGGGLTELGRYGNRKKYGISIESTCEPLKVTHGGNNGL